MLMIYLKYYKYIIYVVTRSLKESIFWEYIYGSILYHINDYNNLIWYQCNSIQLKCIMSIYIK